MGDVSALGVKLGGELERLRRKYLRHNVHLTLIVRVPGDVEGDIVVTADDLDQVAAVMQRTIAREADRG